MFYSLRFALFSEPIHWLGHGHVSYDNETVYRQMPLSGQHIVKTMTPNGKQFTVTREMLTAVARNVQLKVA